MMLTPPAPPLLPEPIPNRTTSFTSCFDRYSATAKRQKFLKRLLKIQHMDFQFALWQMLYLLISPQKVFRDFKYRKQTKNQWARDDPAFLVLLSCFLLISSVLFGLVLKLHFIGLVKFVLWVVFIDCICVGLFVATIYWYVANKFLLKEQHSNIDVEWAFCFDVHLNAFFPLLVILHIIQLPFFMTIIYREWFISTLVGNTFWLFGIGYYLYILFLGFSTLPFLKNTHVLLYPFTALILFYILTLSINASLSRILMNVYEYRVGLS